MGSLFEFVISACAQLLPFRTTLTTYKIDSPLLGSTIALRSTYALYVAGVRRHRAQSAGTQSQLAGRPPAATQDLFRELAAIFAAAQTVRQHMEYSTKIMEPAIFRYPYRRA